MFNVGPAEVLIILVVALLVLGPKKLPEAARQIGKAMTEFRRVTSGLQDEVRSVFDDHLEPGAPPLGQPAIPPQPEFPAPPAAAPAPPPSPPAD